MEPWPKVVSSASVIFPRVKAFLFCFIMGRAVGEATRTLLWYEDWRVELRRLSLESRPWFRLDNPRPWLPRPPWHRDLFPPYREEIDEPRAAIP